MYSYYSIAIYVYSILQYTYVMSTRVLGNYSSTTHVHVYVLEYVYSIRTAVYVLLPVVAILCCNNSCNIAMHFPLSGPDSLSWWPVARARDGAPHFVSARTHARCTPLWRGASVPGRAALRWKGEPSSSLGALCSPPRSHLGALPNK
jgi:hypothetical protein